MRKCQNPSDGLREHAAYPLTKAMQDVWTRVFVQQVIDTHNSAYSKNLSIHGRAQEIYPDLQGQLNWDWVCRERTSGLEVAVEVKQLTRQLVQETHSELKKISAKVQGKVQGFVLLSVYLPRPELKRGSAVQQELIQRLAEFVVEKAQKVPDGRTITTRVEEAEHNLSAVLPAGTWLDLRKEDPAKLKPDARQLNCLHIDFYWGWSAATRTLADEELVEFRGLITKANNQLGVANQRGIAETFLVLVEIGFSGAAPDAVKNTLDDLAPDTYSNINHIYLVGSFPARRVGGMSNPPPDDSAPL